MDERTKFPEKYTTGFAIIAASQPYIRDTSLFNHLYTCTLRYFGTGIYIRIARSCIDSESIYELKR